jgi:opacity protein-like surface antigen
MKFQAITRPVVFFTLLFLYSGVLHAMDVYVAGRAGISMPDESELTSSSLPGAKIDLGFKDNIVGAAAVGLRNGAYRTEVEMSYQKNNLDSIKASGITINPATVGLSGNISALTTLVSGYYDFDTGSRLKPFITAGVGFTLLDASFTVTGVSGISSSDKDTVLSYQLGAGLGYAVTDKITVEVGYRHLSGHDAKFNGDTVSFTSNNITAGVRIHF